MLLNAFSEHLCVEQRSPGRGAIDGLSEAAAFIAPASAEVVFLDLECQLATPERSCLMLDRSEQAPADTLASTVRQHGEIVHVDQRARLKCREPDEACSDPDRVIVEIRKPDDRVSVPLEPRNQAIEDRFW
jgi:hypothetical protein